MAAPSPDPVAARLAVELGVDPRTLRSAGGASGATWLLDGASRVLRVGPAARMARELAAHTAAAGAVPVPAVLGQVEEAGTTAVLLALLPGRPALVAARDRPDLAARVGAACGDLHDRLAAVPAPAALSDATPCPEPRLLHLDLHPLNVLVDDLGVVTGVLDWANAAGGDPALDRARTWTLLTLDPAVAAFGSARWWRDLVDAWAGAGRLDDLAPGSRAWACRYMLDDLGRRVDPVGLAPVRRALRQAEREPGSR